jgi:hypothetical protein
MYLELSVTRLFHVAAIVLILVLSPSVAGYSQPSAPPKDIKSFFHEIIGDWIGTVEEYTDGVKADTKYFHAALKQTSSDTYEAVFDYYRLDKKTLAPVQIGATKMTNKITPNGTATNTITGKGEVFIDLKTLKPEEHTLSEVLHMSPSGNLEGEGSGKISVSGIILGAGKNGKVSAYTSTWVLKDGILNITEQLRVTFHILFFAKHSDIVDYFKGTRGSDIEGLMKRAGDNLNSNAPTPNH